MRWDSRTSPTHAKHPSLRRRSLAITASGHSLRESHTEPRRKDVRSDGESLRRLQGVLDEGALATIRLNDVIPG